MANLSPETLLYIFAAIALVVIVGGGRIASNRMNRKYGKHG